MMGQGHGQQREVDNSKLYETLGVSKTATAAEIKKAYRQAALKEHPDRGGNKERFQEIQQANEWLSDANKRD